MIKDTNDTHFRKLERMYLSANINKTIFDTTTIAISHKKSEVALVISPNYYHRLGAMHGAVYFKLLDDAAFFAANSVIKDVFVLTASFNIHFMRPVTKGKITAIAHLKSQTRQLLIAEASLYNEDGKEIAFGIGSFMKSRVLLSPEIGYL